MPRSGTLVICVQNLDYSGANQVVLNIVSGRMHESNVIVLSPKIGAFAARFIDSGAAIRIGNISKLLLEIRDVFCIICNTIMTADTVCEMAKRPQPVIWILHEWWDDKMIQENLSIRNIGGLTLDTVKCALSNASMIVFVCEAQRKLYKPNAPSTVIYVGVPSPATTMAAAASDYNSKCTSPTAATSRIKNNSGSANNLSTSFNYLTLKSVGGGDDGNNLSTNTNKKPFTFLCLGIVCPRKNQIWAVKLFKKFAGPICQDVRLIIVGARYTRQYEMDYLTKLKKCIGKDTRIELHDVTDDVDQFYRRADCLLFTSTNEVTPMVISEAMSWSLPVLSTNIAGIPEMITDGVEGFLFAPHDDTTALSAMNEIVDDEILRLKMGTHGLQRFKTRFDLDIMVESYRDLVMTVAPPIILIDMDGVLVDWDKGFYNAWNNRCEVDREKSYFMEQCVNVEYKREAELLIHSAGFFESLPVMSGALEALEQMISGDNAFKCKFKVFICTSPVMTSHYCAQEKLNWIRMHLGEVWLDKMILCFDKSAVKGDILIDDKPLEYLTPGGRHTTATWKQVVFDAPYNRQIFVPRLYEWNDWRRVILPLFGRSDVIDEMYRLDSASNKAAAAMSSFDEHAPHYQQQSSLPVVLSACELIQKLSPKYQRSRERLAAAALRSAAAFPSAEGLSLLPPILHSLTGTGVGSANTTTADVAVGTEDMTTEEKESSYDQQQEQQLKKYQQQPSHHIPSRHRYTAAPPVSPTSTAATAYLTKRLKAKAKAQHKQDMYLGSLYTEPVNPEDVAAIAGYGSLFVEDADLQARAAAGSGNDGNGNTSDTNHNHNHNVDENDSSVPFDSTKARIEVDEYENNIDEGGVTITPPSSPSVVTQGTTMGTSMHQLQHEMKHKSPLSPTSPSSQFFASSPARLHSAQSSTSSTASRPLSPRQPLSQSSPHPSQQPSQSSSLSLSQRRHVRPLSLSLPADNNTSPTHSPSVIHAAAATAGDDGNAAGGIHTTANTAKSSPSTAPSPLPMPPTHRLVMHDISNRKALYQSTSDIENEDEDEDEERMKDATTTFTSNSTTDETTDVVKLKRIKDAVTETDPVLVTTAPPTHFFTLSPSATSTTTSISYVPSATTIPKRAPLTLEIPPPRTYPPVQPSPTITSSAAAAAAAGNSRRKKYIWDVRKSYRHWWKGRSGGSSNSNSPYKNIAANDVNEIGNSSREADVIGGGSGVTSSNRIIRTASHSHSKSNTAATRGIITPFPTTSPPTTSTAAASTHKRIPSLAPSVMLNYLHSKRKNDNSTGDINSIKVTTAPNTYRSDGSSSYRSGGEGDSARQPPPPSSSPPTLVEPVQKQDEVGQQPQSQPQQQSRLGKQQPYRSFSDESCDTHGPAVNNDYNDEPVVQNKGNINDENTTDIPDTAVGVPAATSVNSSGVCGDHEKSKTSDDDVSGNQP